MHNWTTGFINSGNTMLHYYRTGGLKPPLVLVHGITDDGLCWTPAAEVFSEDYDVIMVDVRAHGKSDAPDDGYDYGTMAAEVADLINSLELEEPVVLGHSMGALTALVLAGIYPDLPGAILLEDPPAFWVRQPLTQEDDENQGEFIAWLKGLKRKTWDDLMLEIRETSPDWEESEIKPWINSKHRFSQKVTRLVESQNAVPANFTEQLSRIRCPVLLITADPQKRAIVTDQDADELRESVTHLQRVYIPGAGHNIRRDQFTKYIDIVSTFLSELGDK